MISREHLLIRLQILIQSLHERLVDELHSAHKPPFYRAVPYTFEDRLSLLFPQDAEAALPSLVTILEAEAEPDYNGLAVTFLCQGIPAGSAGVLPAIHVGGGVLGPSIGRAKLVYHFCAACQHSHYAVPGSPVVCHVCDQLPRRMPYVSFQDVVVQQEA